MIRERHVILKAALHSGLYRCLAAVTTIIKLFEALKLIRIIGASLSEPHTYRTAAQNPPYIIAERLSARLMIAH